MKVLNLCRVEKRKLLKLLSMYTSTSRQDTLLDINLYKKIYFKGYSVKELAKIENLASSTIYRRVKKVDNFIKEHMEECI